MQSGLIVVSQLAIRVESTSTQRPFDIDGESTLILGYLIY